MPLVNLILFVIAAIFAITLIIGFAFKLIGFLFAAAVIVVAALWIRSNLRARKS